MLNELYTFAEPVQVVPFSSLKWGKFTLLHTHYNNGVFTMYVRKIRKGVFVYPKWDFSRQEYPIDWPRLRLLINGYKVVQK